MNFQKEKKTFKIIVVGDSNVGKTCLTYRFCDGKYQTQPEATIGVDFRERVVNIGGEEVKLQLWDTAGQERFRKAMVQHYYRNAHAVVIVYDVTKMSTFQNVPVWLEECERHNITRQIPRILVGNKCDCVESVAVSTNLAQRLADSHNMPLFETSAQTDSEASNIDAIFLTLAHKLTRQRPLMAIGPSSSLENNTMLHRADIISISRSTGSSGGSGKSGSSYRPGISGSSSDSSWCSC
ncbi:putative Ras-related protein Rab-33 [Macrosteles quadrilineatus]|uniref:putative Ras-related protein Rab-33 n=1 Tax=Macrosteles quadrilineatus TaxID=74068 RepID=UPI0023E0A836|nr:putative Ras-related protein Rab-33 [Macrosteles quadrilineatus]